MIAATGGRDRLARLPQVCSAIYAVSSRLIPSGRLIWRIVAPDRPLTRKFRLGPERLGIGRQATYANGNCRPTPDLDGSPNRSSNRGKADAQAIKLEGHPAGHEAERTYEQRPFNGMRAERRYSLIGVDATSDRKTTESVERNIPQSILLSADSLI